MQIDFNAPILGFDRKPLNESDRAMTLAIVACTALSAQFRDEDNLAADIKYKRFKLGCKIANGGIVDLSVDEIATLKQLIGRAFSPLIVGRSFDLLDPKIEETK
jgi:hypothetical protein